MATFPTFRLLRKWLGPGWLAADEDEGELVGYSLDLIKDAWMQRLYLGHLARFPGAAATDLFKDDVLPAHGRNRRVVRGLFESKEAFANRLLRWLDDRRHAGSALMLLQKLAEWTGPGPSFRVVDARGNWYSRSGTGEESVLLKQGNWNWDGPIGRRWSRFWVIVYPNGLWTETAYEYGDGTDWDQDGVTWGTDAPSEHVHTFRSIVSDWKPKHARCVNIIVAFDANSFNPMSPEPDGLWGGWSKTVGGVRVPSRLSTARYWGGV